MTKLVAVEGLLARYCHVIVKETHSAETRGHIAVVGKIQMEEGAGMLHFELEVVMERSVVVALRGSHSVERGNMRFDFVLMRVQRSRSVGAKKKMNSMEAMKYLEV